MPGGEFCHPSPPAGSEEEEKWLWDQIKAEARLDADAEPALASYLYSTILSHSSLERSLSFHLGNKLCSSTLLSTLLYDLFLNIFSTDASLRSATVADLRAARFRDPACVSFSHCLLNYKGFLACQVKFCFFLFLVSIHHTHLNSTAGSPSGPQAVDAITEATSTRTAIPNLRCIRRRHPSSRENRQRHPLRPRNRSRSRRDCSYRKQCVHPPPRDVRWDRQVWRGPPPQDRRRGADRGRSNDTRERENRRGGQDRCRVGGADTRASADNGGRESGEVSGRQRAANEARGGSWGVDGSYFFYV